MGQSDRIHKVLPKSLDKTPRGGGRQHLSGLVNHDQDIYRHRILKYQDDAAIVSLCRNSNNWLSPLRAGLIQHSKLVVHAFHLDPARGVFGVGHSSSIRMFSSATKHSTFCCFNAFPNSPGRHVVETRRMGIGVMQNDFCS
jgi:hypothetical protein